MSIQHGGDIWAHAARLGCRPSEIADMSSNVNPFGPMPGLAPFLKNRLNEITSLPEPNAQSMIAAAARFYDIPRDRILAGNGTTQWIHAIGPALAFKKVLILSPTYGEYAHSCKAHGIAVKEFHLKENEDFRLDTTRLNKALCDVDALFICNPNNPTGGIIPKSQLTPIIRQNPGTVFIVDESYLPFCDSANTESLAAAEDPNVLVLHSMSKIFRIPGLRIGFVMGPPALLARLKPHDLPWSVNTLAQAAIRYVMDRPGEAHRFMNETRWKLTLERRWFSDRLHRKTALKVFPSVTSFVMVRLPEGHEASKIMDRLLSHRILIRNCDNFSGLNTRYIRISLKKRQANRTLANRLIDFFPNSSPKGVAPWS